MKKGWLNDFYAILTFAIVSLALIPFYILPAFIGGDDLVSHTARAFLFYKSVTEGLFYPRVSDHTSFLGYPVYNFRPPLLHFLWLLPLALTKDPLFSTLFIFFCGFFFSMLAFYLSFKKIFSKQIIFLGALFYGLFPYHIIDAYYRTALAEFYAFIFIPPFIRSVFEQAYSPTEKKGLILAIMLALLVLSHNITALYVIMLCAVWMIVLLRGFAPLLRIALPFALGLGLCSFYWLPALVEFRYIDPNILKAPITQSFLSFKELFYIGPPLTFELSKLSLRDPITTCLPLTIGMPYTFFLVMLILGLFHTKLRGLSIFLILSSLVSLFIMTPCSSFLWFNFKPIKIFQFAWRFLAWIGFSASLGFCIGMFILSERFKLKKLWQQLICLFALVFVFMYATSFYVTAILWRWENIKSIPRLSREHMFDPIDDWHRDFIPRWVDLAGYKTQSNALIIRGNVNKMYITRRNFHRLDAKITADGDAEIVLNLLFFPGWKLKVDGQPEKLKISERGFLQFSIPQGQHLIELKFRPTPTRCIAFLISLASLAIALWFIFGKHVGIISASLTIAISIISIAKGVATFDEYPPMPKDKIFYRWGCEIDADESFIVKSVPDHITSSRVKFDNKLEFIGYRYSVKKTKSGGFLELELYWKCLSSMDKDYAVFILFQPTYKNGEEFGTSHHPVCWTYETSNWKEGEIIRESYKFAIKKRLLGKSYTMIVGILDENANMFLPISGQDKNFFETDVTLK